MQNEKNKKKIGAGWATAQIEIVLQEGKVYCKEARELYLRGCYGLEVYCNKRHCIARELYCKRLGRLSYCIATQLGVL